jgi:transcriptional regulator with XRE-family HTH domain
METAGQKLKRARERLRLRYRDVEEASQALAARHSNGEFLVALSRLSDIENKGTVPSIYRLYSLCAIYRLNLNEVLSWYGVRGEDLVEEARHVGLQATHTANVPSGSDIAHPPELPASRAELGPTQFLGSLQRWGKAAVASLAGADSRHYRYGYIGLDDWSMYPLLQPGALVVIDEKSTRISAEGWAHESERPIYFLEHRGGYACGWCSVAEQQMIVQPHPASTSPAMAYAYPGDIEVLGQVVGIAMLLNSKTRRIGRPGAIPATSANR